MPEPLDLASRRRIYRHIQRHPGKYLRELQRELDLAMGSLEYHLHELERADLVRTRMDQHKRFFPADLPPEARPVMALLRQRLPRRVLVVLLEAGARSKTELLERLDVPRSTLQYHLRHLGEAGLVRVHREGREALYQLVEPARVEPLLVAYHASFMDRVVDRFLEGTGALR